MSFRPDTRSATPVVGNVLLVAVVLVLAVTVTTLAFAFLENTGTPTAEATFDIERTSAGMELVATNLGQSVTVQLNGEDVRTLTTDDVGEAVLLPTAPGDRVTVVSRDGERSLLLEEQIDDRSEVGDFIAYYTFESGSGSTVVDRSQNDNDGTLDTDGADGPTWAANSLVFDGTDDYVTVPDITTGGVDSVESFTVAATVQFDGETGARQQIVEHSFGSNEWFLETIASEEPFDVAYAVNYPDEVITSARSIDVGQQVVVVGTYDGATDEYRLYVDGTQVASDSFDRSVEMGSLRLGRDYESSIQYLDGRLSEFRLYYTAFDDGEVGAVTDAMR